MHIDGIWCKDDAGRTLLLRGANLGGSTKLPYRPNGATSIQKGFFEHRDVSFIGRPFPIDEADEHFGRLRAWGMTFLRLLTTWEAIEHSGPGQYDQEYLDYLRAIVEKAAEYDIDVFIDPHQDVWSRWTGGDGAPGWTFDTIGLDISRLDATGTAISHQMHGDPFPRMIWPTNYTKLGCATMFTLFFGGNEFAPQSQIGGLPIQEYLQSHYIRAMMQVARRLKGLPNVVGYDSLNEPGSGYIGLSDLQSISRQLITGEMPTPYQGMLLGAGYPQEVGVWEFGLNGPQQTGTTVLNPQGLSVWREGKGCIWKQHGVWSDEDGTPRLLRPDYFASGSDFADRYLKPFVIRFTDSIRAIDPDTAIFLEGVPGGAHPHWGAHDPPKVINAGHWYDTMTLFTKHYNPEMTLDWATGQPRPEGTRGADAVQRSFADQLGRIKQSSTELMGGIPTLIGEFGIPFDLDDKAAYSSGDFSTHVQALDAYIDAMDEHLLNYTIWNYTADNTNQHGDLWNDEDLSIFSRDQQDDPDDIDSGGRGLAGIVRPYARRTAGEPLRMRFDLATRTFELTFRPDPSIAAPTEIFVPSYQYPEGYDVEASAGSITKDPERMRLLLTTPGVQEPVTVRLRPTAV